MELVAKPGIELVVYVPEAGAFPIRVVRESVDVQIEIEAVHHRAAGRVVAHLGKRERCSRHVASEVLHAAPKEFPIRRSERVTRLEGKA